MLPELKKKGLPWEKAKAWDNSAAIGKWVPVQELKNRKDIQFGLMKNGEGRKVMNVEFAVAWKKPDGQVTTA